MRPTTKTKIRDEKNLFLRSRVFLKYKYPLSRFLLIWRKLTDNWKLVSCRKMNRRGQLLIAPSRLEIKCKIHFYCMQHKIVPIGLLKSQFSNFLHLFNCQLRVFLFLQLLKRVHPTDRSFWVRDKLLIKNIKENNVNS